MKTSELTGAHLDYWVAKSASIEVRYLDSKTKSAAPHFAQGADAAVKDSDGFWETFAPSVDWPQGGPIIERERINLLETAKWPTPGVPPQQWRWTASLEGDTSYYGFEGKRQEGPTPLIAAMRAYVASKFGEEVPDA